MQMVAKNFKHLLYLNTKHFLGFMLLISLLAVGGFFLIFLEFFLPGMIFAIAGSVALVASLVLFFLSHSLLYGLFYAFFVLILLVFVCKTALFWIKRSKAKDQFYLGSSQEGFVASQFDASAIGKQGIAFTELKPAGHVLVDGKLCQALSERGYIAKDSAILVVAGKGGHLLVKQQE